jgi:4-hydroxybenzoate polyprenyltransferase
MFFKDWSVNLNIIYIITFLVFLGFIYSWYEKSFLSLATILLLFIWVILLIFGHYAELEEKKKKD